MKAYRITTPFWAESGKEGKREHGGCCIVSGGFVVATRLRTLTGSVRSRAKQAICESTSYHDTILGLVWEGGGRVVLAVQPHRQVRPGSWLVKAYRITTPFSAESGKEGEEGTWRLMYSQWGRGGYLSSAVYYGHVAGGIGASTRSAVPQVSSVCYWHASPLCCQSVSTRYRGGGGLLLLSSRTVR